MPFDHVLKKVDFVTLHTAVSTQSYHNFSHCFLQLFTKYTQYYDEHHSGWFIYLNQWFSFTYICHFIMFWKEMFLWPCIQHLVVSHFIIFNIVRTMSLIFNVDVMGFRAMRLTLFVNAMGIRQCDWHSILMSRVLGQCDWHFMMMSFWLWQCDWCFMLMS